MTTLRRVARRVVNWFSGLARMSWRERRHLLVALVLNPWMKWLLTHRGTSAAASFVHRHSADQFQRAVVAVDDEVLRQAKRTGAVVNRAALEPAPAVTCLARSLTAQLLLRRRGVPAELCIGVRPASEADRLDAATSEGQAPLLFHAWVEVAGVPINDALDVAAQHAVFPLDGLETLAGFGSGSSGGRRSRPG